MDNAENFPELADVLDTLDSEGDEHGRGRVLLAAAAYPGYDDGLPFEARNVSRDGPAARFCEAMLDWRLNQEPLAAIRKQIGNKVKRRKYESWIGIYNQGLQSLRAAEAAYWARMTAGYFGAPLSRVIERSNRTLTADLSIYKRNEEATEFDAEYVAKRIRSYDPVVHLIHALREVSAERIHGRWLGNLGNIAAAVPLLLGDYEDWPTEVVASAEHFQLTQASHFGLSPGRLLPLTKKATQIT